jgi:hypothetical protein
MTLENLEAEVLLLPKQSQVTLLTRMLERLGQSNEIDQEVASVWVEEAESHDRVMDDGQVAGTPCRTSFSASSHILTMISAIFHSLAEQELLDAVSYYEEQDY